ncbi:MAG: DNA-binding protein [Candidatus Nanopelagicales bacterium]|nr:DNA-binding protein [Candidatus Nanopelagicales bacterium]
MNKADLIDNVAERLGHSKKDVTDIVDAFLLETKKAVAKGNKVAVAGFGVFESTARKARIGRNPRTGEAVKIKATKLPKFRPGAEFKGVVSGAKKLVEPGASKVSKPAAKKATAKKTTAKKASKPAAKKATAKKTSKPAAKKATARKTSKPAAKKR